MRGPIAYVAMIACSAMLAPYYAAGEEPAGRTGPAPEMPSTDGWAIRMQADPPVEEGDRSPASVGPEELRNAEETGISDTVRTEVGERGFLMPTWSRGFRVMPPGGLTRRLIPARGFINSDETLAPEPVVGDLG